jgi:cobyrinic acid a,c-diamide synthase
MQRNIPRIVIAATSSGSGKTTIVTGILSTLREQGYRVQSYKIGPDYIDPGYHEQASGRTGHNLDTWLVPKEKLVEMFLHGAGDADIAVIEGVMGLYDGGRGGISSTAEIAKLLHAPVLLVLDAKSMGESAAAVALGFKIYDTELQLAGVILNRLGSPTHREMIASALTRLDIPVFGALLRNEAMRLPERHLGLLPAAENQNAGIIAEIGRSVAGQVDINRILALAATAPGLEENDMVVTSPVDKVKIAVARDEAFSFYYPESLAVLEKMGARLVYFSPLHDVDVPDADGVILGGGFPEIFADVLYANVGMRRSLKDSVKRGMPLYAECGGFMYLMDELKDFDGKEIPMTGIIPGTVQMNRSLQMVGYVEAEMQCDTLLGAKGTVLHGHEFHFSAESTELPYANRAFVFTRMRNKSRSLAGYAKDNILGSYLHLHFAGCPEAARHFILHCAEYKKKIGEAGKAWEK